MNLLGITVEVKEGRTSEEGGDENKRRDDWSERINKANEARRAGKDLPCKFFPRFGGLGG